MLRTIDNLGVARRGFSLFQSPPRLFTTRQSGHGEEVIVFEPYEENLPLESGYYTFVIDQSGRFRIRRGNTSSHARFVKADPIGAAGFLRINRNGSVAEVSCQSYNYRVVIRGPHDLLIDFVIQSFLRHHAFEVSPHCVFRFARGVADNLWFSIDRSTLSSERIQEFFDHSSTEGQGDELLAGIREDQRLAFASYQPDCPSRLYSMHLDQIIIAVEMDADNIFEKGAGEPPYRPESPPLTSGKKAFILNEHGWLVLGHGHHLLSGGQPVGAAGQIVFDEQRIATEINLNFSGHYRPPLDADYARTTYRVIAKHPLIEVHPACRISGRKFDGDNIASTVLRFTKEELLSDDPDLDFAIETAMI